MIKILFFIPGLSGGGAEKVLCNLVNNMDQSKFDITVQTIDYYEPKQYLVEGIHYKSIFHSKSTIAMKISNYWYRFCTELKLTYLLYVKDNYDIEVAYLECGATKVMAASTNKMAAKLAWVHCDVKKKGLTAKKIGKYYSKFDKVICVSQEAKKKFDEVFEDYAESMVLYNVIDEAVIYQKLSESKKLDWNADVIHLLTVGRLSYEKGCDRLIKVCKWLRNDGYKFQVHLLGEGPEKERLQSEVDKNQLSKHLVFEGFSTNPYQYMSQADLVIIPSRTEALSTVAIEALILGKPVVTTPCSGMKELYGESKYGIITEDSTISLYSNIKRMINSPDLLRKYSEAAKKRGLDFRKEEIVKKTEEWFEKLLSERN